MKTRAVQILKNKKRCQVIAQVFTCPICEIELLATQEVLDKFEFYICPDCENEIYFEDAV